MAFQSITALWWLLPLTGIIILLYLLKMRRRDVRVPAVFLWPSLTADIRANAPFQKLRISLLLILQLLVLTLLVCAFANPLRQTRGLHGKATVIVLDASGSMGATDVAPSRFEAARRRVTSIIATMGTGDHLALIEAGATTRVVFPLSSSKAKMTAALRGIHPTDAPNDMGEALRLAAALVGQRPGSRIVVLSDGSFPSVTDFSPGKAELLFDRIGVSNRNLAITALDSSVMPDGGKQLFVGVHNYFSSAMKAKLVFSVDGHIADAMSIEVQPRHTAGETLSVAATALRADIRLEAPDDILSADNQATLFLQASGAVRTLLVTPGNLFLERALSLEPNVRLDRATAVPDEEKIGSTGDGHYDLVIFDGMAPTPVKAPAVWSFGGIGPELSVKDVGLSSKPRVVSWKRDHPILSHVDLAEILIEKAHKIQQSPAGNVLLTGSDGPLMVTSEAAGQRKLYVAWNLMDSDFPLRVGFPIFVGNAVSWLSGQARAGTARGINARAGQPFSVAAPVNLHSLALHMPDGGSVDLDASSGTATIRSADTVGSYVLTGPKSRTEIAVNLLNDAESDVTPKSAIDLSGHSVGARESSVVLTELWRPIVLMALLLLAGEWWLFVRRS